MSKKIKSIKINAFLNSLKQCCSILFPLITFPYVSRILGSEGYGAYNFSLSITSYFVLFASLGINAYTVREGSKIRNNTNEITIFSQQMFSINLCTVLLSYICMIGIISFIPKLQSYACFIFIQSIAMILMAIGADWINSIYEDYLYITVRYIFFQILALISTYLFVKTKTDIWKYCIIALLAANGGNLINVFYIRKYVKIQFTFQMSLKKHLKPMILLFLNSIAITIYVNADITMLGFYKTDDVVGVYSFASKIYNILKQLINAIIIVTIPRIAFLAKNNNKDYKKIICKLYNILTVLLLPVVTGLYMMGEEIIVIAGGSMYISGSTSLRILSIAILFAIYGSLFSNCILIVNNREKKCLQATLISAFINVALNFVFIPLWGISGAAVTTVIAESVSCALHIYFARDIIDWRKLNHKESLSCILGCFMIFLLCIISKEIFKSYIVRFLISIVLSCFAYVLILVFKKNEIFCNLLKSIIRKK